MTLMRLIYSPASSLQVVICQKTDERGQKQK